MPNISFPSSSLFHYPILLVLADGQEHTKKEFIAKEIEVIGISKEQQLERIPSGGNKLSSWTGYAIRNLKDANLITSTKVGSGKYLITETGKLLLQKRPNGFKGARGDKLIELVQSLGIQKNDDNTNDPEQREDTKQETSITVKLSDLAASANATLPDSLLEAVKQMNPKSFEVLIKILLTKMGYGNTTDDVVVTQYVHDDGIDGYVRKDPLGIEKLCAYQAKRYTTNKVGSTDMQALGGAMINYGTQCGICVTTSDFTPSAKDYNPRGFRIIRINGKQLVGLLIEYGIGVKIEHIEVKTVDVDFLQKL